MCNTINCIMRFIQEFKASKMIENQSKKRIYNIVHFNYQYKIDPYEFGLCDK